MVYTWNLNPVALSFAGLQVHWYGLMYVANFFLFLYLGWWLHQRFFSDRSNIDWKVWENLLLGGFLAGVVGGRLGYMLFYSTSELLSNPLSFFKVWEGGMSIHGGVIGAILYGLWWTRYKEQSFLKMVDIFILPLCLALFLGRLVNFVNGELYGRVNLNDWGVIFPHIDNAVRYPSQLFEALKNLVMAAVFSLILFKGIKLKPGSWLALFLILYGVFRFIIEFYREPEIYLGPLTMGQALCTIMVAVGIGLLVYLYSPSRK